MFPCGPFIRQDFGPIDVDAVLGPMQPNFNIMRFDRNISSKLNTKHPVPMMGKGAKIDRNIASAATHHAITGIPTSIQRYDETNIITPPPTQLFTAAARQRGVQECATAAVAAEWGLTNPNTIRNMLARRRRLQKLASKKIAKK